jgi:GNAT superfamily N-acetyltransferase
MAVEIVEREISQAEYARMSAGFEEHALEFGVGQVMETRYTFVAMDGEKFVGCASGLQYQAWFYLTDLWLEKPYRHQHLGAQLLQNIEARVKQAGVRNIWTWTAGYEAAPFYEKQGYSKFCEFEDYFPGGYSRIGLRKSI